jgi:hypothetical protein
MWRHIGTASSANILFRYLLSFCSLLHYEILYYTYVRQRAVSKNTHRFSHVYQLCASDFSMQGCFGLEKGLAKQARKITTLRAISIPVSIKMSASDMKLSSYPLLLESRILCFV